MDVFCNDLSINEKNVNVLRNSNCLIAVIHHSWFKSLIKYKKIDKGHVNCIAPKVQTGENLITPWRKIFVQTIEKRKGKVLPLARSKPSGSRTEAILSFTQILQYVSHTNYRNLWKECFKKYSVSGDTRHDKDTSSVNLVDHDNLICEIILRIYGCEIIKIGSDLTSNVAEFSEVCQNRSSIKTYQCNPSLLSAVCALDSDKYFYIIHETFYQHNLLDALMFSPALLDSNQSRGMFIIFQLVQLFKIMYDRGLHIGNVKLEDIYLNENMWLQVMPSITNSIVTVEPSIMIEHGKITSSFHQSSLPSRSSKSSNKDSSSSREKIVCLETVCNLWIRGRISNLDYLIHLNSLAGRSAGDPRVHPVVPWVTDFTSRCGKNWRDLTKSKYRLTKGDRQLDLTYDAMKEGNIQTHPHQVPHHVSDVLSDITYYVYMARRTPKNVLCHFVRNNWVPAEYPVSIQRMQEWTPDECIPEFYTDPTVFKSLHEDLHDLEIPTWATCIEDFIYKHREALESIHVSENLHHWIDLTFGYKLSGPASVKAKNVCLSLVDNHVKLSSGGAVQLLNSPHPMRKSRPLPPWGAPSPPRIYRTTKDNNTPKRNQKTNESSDELSEDDDTNYPKHLSRLSSQGENRSKSRSVTRSKRNIKKNDEEAEQENTTDKVFHSGKYLKAQKSEWGKDVIYLPKDYNAVGTLANVENYHLFRSKTFYNQSEFVENDDLNSKLSPTKSEMINDSISSGYKADINSDEHSFTNQMFVKSYEQMYLRKKFSSSSDVSFREWKDRSFNSRVVTDWSHYKDAVLRNKKKDMQVLGCLIIEIFLHQQLRPLRSKMNIGFEDRLACCRLVFREHYSIFPKFAGLTVKLLLDMESSCVTLKGLPMPTSSQLLQPLLFNHMIPFPKYFPILYSMITALGEYSTALDELDILYSFNCDGQHCSKYEHLERTKFRMSQKIADGKVYSFSRHLEMFIKQITRSRVESFDLFVPYFTALLDNNDTAILAAWYLFDPVSQILGPSDTSKRLLTLILRLYDDDNPMDRSDIYCKSPEAESPTAANCSVYVNRKSIKLYHHIFLLQLIVRFGLKCFLENFAQRLVEAVGGYKDLNVNDFAVHTHSGRSICRSQSLLKKLRCCDESLKVAMSAPPDVLSPDTSCGSENIIITPNIDVTMEIQKSNPNDASAESEVFHFESEPLKSDCTSSRKDSSYIVNEIDSSGKSRHGLNTSIGVNKYSNSAEFDDSTPYTATSPLKSLILEDRSSALSENDNAELKSPTITIPANKNTFTSYVPADADGDGFRNVNNTSKSLDFSHSSLNHGNVGDKPSFGAQSTINASFECKISEVSSESLLWLAHRLGPVLTCIYLTRNLLKMLTLCYIGPENLVPVKTRCSSGMESLSIAKSQIVGDANAAKVIECLTSIAALYGEQLILMQYLPHVGKLIASCRRRLSVPLEGGLIACLQLLRYLVPCMSDVKLMEQLQDIILKNILHPTVRLLSSTRSTFPSGSVARSALAKKFVDAMYVIALRIGPEMTRRHLCVPALQRFFLAFDKACGKIDTWIKPRPDTPQTSKSADGPCLEFGDETGSAYLEICRDGSTAEWRVVDGNVVGKVPGDSSCSPPPMIDQNELELSALQELQEVFQMKLAHRSFIPFSKFVGEEAMERSLKNSNTLKVLCQEYLNKNGSRRNSHFNEKTSPILKESGSDCNLNKKEAEQGSEPIRIGVNIHPVQCQRAIPQDLDDGSSSNSFGSNAPLIGNRIDVPSFDNPRFEYDHAFDIVSCKLESGEKASRHLKGDWLLYWEHEIGRPDKDNRFNLKQIKLQTFAGHTHSVKSIVVLDNENSFMTGSKDKTVKLWSLRNTGDGSSTSTCQWTYTAHKKGILSLTFLDTLRLAVSTDSNVHIWDPYIESVVSQLDNPKNAAISIVRAFPAPSTSVIAATTDNTLKIIDTRTCSFVQDLKVASIAGVSASAAGSIRSLCCSPNGQWLAVALGGGAICVLDTRTGTSLATWRAHDTEPLKICAAGDNTIVSSGLDFVVAAWRPQDGRLQAHLKGASEPVHCMATYGGELITGTTNNRIGVHTAIHQDASFSSTKLRGDVFRGSLTSMAVLPLNRLLLLGGDAGHISLIC